MCQLVWLEGKHTVQTAHCALGFGEVFLLENLVLIAIEEKSNLGRK